jgi:hypothetical protein
LVSSGKSEDVATLGAIAAAAQIFRLQYSTVTSVNQRLHSELAKARQQITNLTKASRPGTPRDPIPATPPATPAALPIGTTAEEAFAQFERVTREANS